MKDWQKELILGFLFVVAGVVFLEKFLRETIIVIIGSIGPLLLFLGLIFMWIGVEDKKLEKELEELEKELEEEESSESNEQQETKDTSGQ